LSTAVVHAHPESSWKQEVNRRLAEHRGRKPASQPEQQAQNMEQHNASRRAQEAAARVAARYAKAPSYSEVLANEARAALRAAEAASEAAFHAKAAAESVLANIEANSAAMDAEEAAMTQAEFEPFLLEPAVVEPPAVRQKSSPAQKIAEPAKKEIPAKKETIDTLTHDGQPLSVRWATELPARHADPVETHAGHGFAEDWAMQESAEPMAPGAGEIEMVEAALPIYGNLIEFPREIVATRKVRPRLAESPNADASHVQLSIFEVDPATVGTDPSAETLQASGAGWAQPAWSSLELDAQPAGEYEEVFEEPAPRRQMTHDLQRASLNRRVMALFVDGTLIVGSLVCAAALVLDKAASLPSMSAMEHISAAAFVVIAALYMTLFYALAPATPGMVYARIRFCTFEGLAPTRSQRWHRLGAMLLSVLPAGLGLAWSLFDDDHLSWHDRLSRTYLCNV
jgi:uncharacterized RDD family membrane protein YckC